MVEEIDLKWIKDLSKRIPVIPPTLSLIFGFSCFIVYMSLMRLAGIYDSINIYNFIQIVSFCGLLTYLLIFSRYILDQIKTIMRELKFNPEYGMQKKELIVELDGKFSNFKDFYIIVILVIASFFIIDYIKIFLISNDVEKILFGNIFLDTYNYLLLIFMLYLISAILWMILKISLLFDAIGKKPYKHYIQIDLFNADRIGGLSVISELIIKILLYYSLGISLAMFSYIDPRFFSVIFEVMALALLLVAGIILLLRGLQNLEKPFLAKMSEDLYEINKEYQNQYKNLTRIISDKKETDEALASVTKRIEALNKERAEREKILNENRNKYGYSAIILAAVSFIMPILSLYGKLKEVGLLDVILKIFNN